ncbi:enoyl-CoA hydratase-related protein [Mycolicibacillus trivialis]|nr:enoyl-CoA hydratase-related protein [Mycolicibacillus trivialis]
MTTASNHPMFDWNRTADGVVVLTMNDVDNPANTVNDRFRHDFSTVLDRIEAERDTVAGVVLTSGKSTFFAGADLSEFAALGPDAIAEVAAMLDTLKVHLRRLETLGRPVVAALNGAALGGGYELALACHYRIVVDDPTALVGLPESKLGVLPGAGGTVRTVRMFGMQKALEEILLPGTRFTPSEALAVGLVDEVVDEPDELIVAAARWIAAHPEPKQPWDEPGARIPGGAPGEPRTTRLLTMLPARLIARTRGASDAAAEAILATVVEGARVDFATAQTIESRHCAALIASPASSNIIAVTFFEPREIRRATRRPAEFQGFRARSALVIGSNSVAAEIARACAAVGIDTTITSADFGAADSVAVAARAQLGRGSGQVRACDIDNCAHEVDVVIESVFDDAKERRRQLASACSRLQSGTLILSNSSALPISELADVVPEPENMVGMHFFTPVDRMTLLEVIESDRTSAEALAKAIDFGGQLGKRSVVMGDRPGFFTTRILHAYLDEALTMLAAGTPAPSIERAAQHAGYPIGPLALADQLSFSVLARIDGEMTNSTSASPSAIATTLGRMNAEFHRTGRAGGRGFYEYEQGSRTGLWPGLAQAFDTDREIPDLPELQDRLLVRQALAALQAREELVARSDAEANVASVFGVGFPSWTGGCLRFADQYAGGLPGFVQRCRLLAEAQGDRFTPSASLVERTGRHLVRG